MPKQPLAMGDELFPLTVATLKQGLAVLDAKATILYANRALADLVDRPVDDLSGEHLMALFDPAAQQVLNEQFALRHKGERGYYELRFTTHRGRQAVALVSAAPLLDAQGRFDCSVAVFTDITDRKHAEEARDAYREQLRALSSELFYAEERERRRLATELHDRIGHALVLAKLKLTELDCEELAEPQAQRVAQITSLLDATIEDTRSLTFEISPPVLHELGLVAALKWLFEQTRSLHGLEVRFDHEVWEQRLSEQLRILLFQAAREVLFNVVKHAQANQVEVSLKLAEPSVLLRIADDGVGFDPAALADHRGAPGGYGLFSIRERLSYIGGELQLESKSGAGTTVSLTAPLEFEAATPPVPSPGARPAASVPLGRQQQIRVVLADDQQLMRQGLRNILSQEPQIEVVAEAANGAEAVELAREHVPDVMVMDIDMPEVDGITAARRIVAELPNVRIIALSMYADRRYVGEMLNAGATGYLLKDCAGEDLARAIYAVNGNLTFLSPRITDIVVEEFVKPPPAEASLAVLTSREREVLKLIAGGQSIKAIALDLELSAKTVYTFRANIMKKLGIDDTAELTKFAIRQGLIELNP